MFDTTEKVLKEWLALGEEAARAGANVLEDWRHRFSVKEKSPSDLVTDADFAAQHIIRSIILNACPDHHFMGEEDTPGTVKGRVALDAPPTWIVDPLDGTANYAHDVPCYCVSIGLIYQGRLLIGVIYDPRQKEMFLAAHGQGATLNGKTIVTSTFTQLRNCLISTGFPPNHEAQERNLHWWRTLSFRAQALRRTGSTALNLAYVAAGRFDAYWAFDNYAWDVAAGIVLVQEAGGIVTRANGSAIDPFYPDILATNGPIHQEFLNILTAQ